MESITHAFYINLAKRVDRRNHVEQELRILGIKADRFEAVQMKNGAIGCTLSHLKCLQHAKEQGWDHVMIVEDDIEFTNPICFKSQLHNFLSARTKDDWDVILLAGNNMPPYTEIDDCCVKVTKCQTTTGYIVNGKYLDTLINNVKSGLTCLIRDPTQPILYAIDKYWFSLQKVDRWFLIIPLTVTQRADYSDIEARNTDYKDVMLDLDKKKFFMKQLLKIKEMRESLKFMPIEKTLVQYQNLDKMEKEIRAYL